MAALSPHNLRSGNIVLKSFSSLDILINLISFVFEYTLFWFGDITLDLGIIDASYNAIYDSITYKLYHDLKSK